MNPATKLVIGTIVALTLSVATIVVYAHPGGSGQGWCMGQDGGPGYGPGAGMWRGMGPADGGPMGYGSMGRGGMGPHAWGNPAAAIESRLSSLKSELKITPDQEVAWKKFADQAKQQAEDMQTLMSAVQGGAQVSAPERLELRNQAMKKRQEQMEKGTTAFKDLYAVLSPEQKARADRHVGMFGGRGLAFNKPAR